MGAPRVDALDAVLFGGDGRLPPLLPAGGFPEAEAAARLMVLRPSLMMYNEWVCGRDVLLQNSQ